MCVCTLFFVLFTKPSLLEFVDIHVTIEFNPTYRHFLLEDPFPLSFQILKIFLYLTGIIIIRLDKLSCKQLGYNEKLFFYETIKVAFFRRAP